MSASLTGAAALSLAPGKPGAARGLGRVLPRPVSSQDTVFKSLRWFLAIAAVCCLLYL